MITGAHFLLPSTDADADRAFLRDVLEFRFVDAGRGWLIFALPPSELAVHPADDDAATANDGMRRVDLFLMCDDLRAQIASLAERGVQCGEIATERWGIRTTIALPSGGAIGLYQPTHETAI